MADYGQICLDYEIPFEERHRNIGSGIINNTYPVGMYFSIRRLIALNLYQSDNVATLMLRDFLGNGNSDVGFNVYRNFVENKGGDPSLVRERIMNSYLTAEQVGIFANAINAYIENGNSNSEEFRKHLMNNQFHFLFDGPRVFDVASKTGWTRGNFHDMSIVYLEGRSFILAILSTDRGSCFDTYARADFALIARTFVEFQMGRVM
jgi:beta-lactamase class A